jgi:hypothetical protein
MPTARATVRSLRAWIWHLRYSCTRELRQGHSCIDVHLNGMYVELYYITDVFAPDPNGSIATVYMRVSTCAPAEVEVNLDMAMTPSGMRGGVTAR